MGLSNILFIPGIGAKFDADAQAYMTAVESADTQALEPAVRTAINAFVVGCKADGIWDAIECSCLLAGPRTLTGALIPIKGAAPTNIGPFVSGDYERTTGLVSNGSTKVLNSNYSHTFDNQNNRHLAVYYQTPPNFGIGLGTTDSGTSQIAITTTSQLFRVTRGADSTRTDTISGASFGGAERSSGSTITGRYGGTTYSFTQVSATPLAGNVVIFGRGTPASPQNVTTSRLAFYSLGRSLNLALLDARITAYLSEIGAAI